MESERTVQDCRFLSVGCMDENRRCKSSGARRGKSEHRLIGFVIPQRSPFGNRFKTNPQAMKTQPTCPMPPSALISPVVVRWNSNHAIRSLFLKIAAVLAVTAAVVAQAGTFQTTFS